MKSNKSILTGIFFLSILISGQVFSQVQKFEINGKLSGKHIGKMYLYFDNDYKRKDSLSSEISNGHFQFRGMISLPVLARIHLGQNSYIVDVYMDRPMLTVDCSNIVELANDNKDTINQLMLISSKGSVMEQTKWNFEKSAAKLKALNISQEEKQELYFKKLSAFVKTNKKSRVSPYLIGKAQILSYDQVYELSQMLDSSLSSTYEANTVKRLLSSLDRSKFRKAGTMFYDVNLSDPAGSILSTKVVRNKFTFYEFWASWCLPCRREHPGLRDFYSRNKANGLEIVSISLDIDKKQWIDAIRKDSLPWTNLSDLRGFKTDICQYYGIKEIPVSFLVDVDGRIIGTNMSIAAMESIINGN